MKPEDEILIFTQGREVDQAALDYGVYMAKLLQHSAHICGVSNEKTPFLDKQIDAAIEQLEKAGIPSRVSYSNREIADAVAEVTRCSECFTVLHSARRRRFWHWSYDWSFHQMIADVESPIVCVPSAAQPLKRLLICTGGLEFAIPLEDLCFQLAKAAQAKAVILHVVPPVSLKYPLAEEVEHHWQTLWETDTPQGKHLRDALARAERMGVDAEILMRNGRVLEELQQVIREGHYDMVGVGSPYSGHGLRRLYRPNVADAIARFAPCPVLVVRAPSG